MRTLTELCRRLGVTIVETCLLRPERNEEPPTGPFDAALVDVPCSNTGVLGRRPEVRWRLRPGDLPRLIALQVRVLRGAARYIRPGSIVVYSTCSIEPGENQGVVSQVADILKLEAEKEQVPGRPSDGGYWARLRRKT